MQKSLQRSARTRLHGQLRAFQSGQADQACGNRVVDGYRCRDLRTRARGMREKIKRDGQLRCFSAQHGLMDERRKPRLLSLRQQLARIRRVIVASQSLIQRMLRKFGLYQHAAAGRAPPSPPGDLSQPRKQALARAKIRAV